MHAVATRLLDAGNLIKHAPIFALQEQPAIEHHVDLIRAFPNSPLHIR
jgi:hypothetical protein